MRPLRRSILYPYTTLFRSKLGLPAGKGFSHYVVRPEMSVEEIIMPSGVHEKVDLIQAGAIPPKPAELLRSEEHTSELHSRENVVCSRLLEKKITQKQILNC